MSAYCHAISNGADKFEVKHWDHRFTGDLDKMTCYCRYWQLSGLPCCHAISNIYFKTNSLDQYIADCYTVENFQRTYTYCLHPVEGQKSWPISDRPKLKAPGYIKMPGSPKTQRTREPHEKPKATKVSRVGSVMRCGKCKCTGHNRASYDRRSGKNQSAGAASDNFSSGNFGAAPSPAPAPTSSVPAAAPSPTPVLMKLV